MSKHDQPGTRPGFSRRHILQGLAGAAALTALPPMSGFAASSRVPTRGVPGSNLALPLVGLGTWITFNVGNDPQLLDRSAAVMEAFFAGGGRMIDSSPMYGSSQNTIGYGLEKLDAREQVFSTDKVWTRDTDSGPGQIRESRREWGIPRFDLLQVHNLLGWRGHLETLKAMKADGELGYMGITTSHGRRHDLFEDIMANQPLDFVQLTYNIVDREPEARLLPLARDRGMGVIVNRPFQRGALIDRLRPYDLPPWAGDIGAGSWAQFILKFIVSHPDVTCAIPATTRVDHMQENLAAVSGTLPDAGTRQRMADYVRNL